MDIIWDGITRAEMLTPEVVQIRNALADAAKSYNWPQMLGLLLEHTDLVNTTRPGGFVSVRPATPSGTRGRPC